jgi:hypothetical protein
MAKFCFMKSTFLLLAAFACFQVVAQNVGIGTTTPAAKLQINHRSSEAPGLQLVDSSGSGGGHLRFRNVNNTVGINISNYNTSNFNKDQYLDITSDSVFLTTFRGNGNVGIRNAGPAYPLDVNGDINTTGTVRVNGNAGANGQVLRSNGDGTMSWGDMSDYKFYETYRAVGTSSWTVPAGVTKIYIELWGAGGGGSIYGGGGGGAYIKAYFTVTAGSSVSYTIGGGGVGGSFAGSSGNTGTTCTVTVGSVTLTAFGGVGGSSNVAGDRPGEGGRSSVTTGFRNFIAIDGKNGQHNQFTFAQRNATTYVITTKYGNGGDGRNAPNKGGIGNYTIINESTAAIIKESYAQAPSIPGGGGGSFVCSICTSNTGAGGQFIVHY